MDKYDMTFKERLKAFGKDWVQTFKKRWWVMLIEFLVIATILVLDLVSKEYIVRFLGTQNGMFYELAPGFINLQYTENTGAGFGMFSGNTSALTALTIILIIVIMAFLVIRPKETMWLRLPLIFIIGGGIGNVVDRIGLSYVRDFIQFAFWKEFAIFNVADMFVTVGAFWLIVVLIVMLVQEGRKNKKKFEEEQAKAVANAGESVDPLDAPINLNPMMQSPNTYTFDETNGENNDANTASSDNDNA